MDSMTPIGVLIAAAGTGTRFIRAGGRGNKLNARLGSQSVFARTLNQALASGLPVHVVTRPENLPVRLVCAARDVPLTLLASQGPGDSIAAGVSATPGWSGWLLQLADMPFVPAAIFRQLHLALQQHPIVRPGFCGRPGHPVGFSAAFRHALSRLRGEQGARSLLRGQPIYHLPVDQPGVLQDIDLPVQLFSLGSRDE